MPALMCLHCTLCELLHSCFAARVDRVVLHELKMSVAVLAQTLLALPLIGLYLGGAAVVRVLESTKTSASTS